MNSVETALVNARVIDVTSTPITGKKEKKKSATPVAAAPVFTAIVNGITVSAPTQDELVALVTKLTGAAAQSTPVATSVTGPRQATKPEACAVHKLFSLMDRVASKVIVTFAIVRRRSPSTPSPLQAAILRASDGQYQHLTAAAALASP
jgi:hypothetical protein